MLLVTNSTMSRAATLAAFYTYGTIMYVDGRNAIVESALTLRWKHSIYSI